jgi:hypothetical protein
MFNMAGRVTTTLFGEIQPDMQILDDALFAMARRGAQVVNMSFGDPSETSLTLPDVHDALLDADEARRCRRCGFRQQRELT